MEDHKNASQAAPETEEHPSPGGGLLTNAARTVGTAIGKVSSTLGLAHTSQSATVSPPPQRVKKKSPAKKVKKPAVKNSAPAAKKAPTKKPAPRKARKSR